MSKIWKQEESLSNCLLGTVVELFCKITNDRFEKERLLLAVLS